MSNLGQKGKLKGAQVYQSISIADRNALVHKYIGLVKRVAMHLKVRLPPQVDLDDMVQSGMVGLLDALNNYKPDSSASFETYAMIRIRGSIIDHMRMYDWTPRGVHQNTRAINAAIAKLSQQLGRQPEPSEIAAELNVDVSRYYQMVADYAQSGIKTMSETALPEEGQLELPKFDLLTGESDLSNQLLDELTYNELCKDLVRSMKDLNERERQVISLYYEHEMNLREIGMIMKMSESRACQLLSSGIEALQDTMSILWKDKREQKDFRDVMTLTASREVNIKRRENVIVEGALPTKKRRHHTDLFADIEAEHEAAERNRPEYIVKVQMRKNAVEGINYDGERFFESYRDEALQDSLSQRFLDGKLKMPECPFKITNNNVLDVDLSLPLQVHSSRPRLLFDELTMYRRAFIKENGGDDHHTSIEIDNDFETT